MFISDFVRRKVAALLRPWFEGEPELELSVGLLRSSGVLNNVSLNASALNELVEDPSRCCIVKATVERLSLEFSPWSSRAFTLVVRGIRIVLSIGEEADEGGIKWRQSVKDTTLEEKNKVLAEIDPEGCSLHASIKRIADVTTRTWGKSSLNTLFVHSEIQFHDVLVLFQSPNSHNASSCTLYTKRIGAGSQNVGLRCFAGGLVASLFLPYEDSSFDIDIASFEIRLNSENHKSCVIPETNMSALVNLKYLQFTRFCLLVPRLIFSFCPADLSVLLLFYALLSNESKSIRSGRLLWKILASRIRSVLRLTNLSMIKIVKIMCLWLRYVKSYENLLLVVGYPVDDRVKRSSRMMFRDTTFSRSVVSQWKNVAKIENDLTPETIASGRQIARFRLVSCAQTKNDSPDELLGNKPFLKLRQLIMLILSRIGALLLLFSRFLGLQKVYAIFSKRHQKFSTFQEDLSQESGISLIFREISVSITPNDPVLHFAPRKAVSVTQLSYQDLLSLHLLVDAVVVKCTTNVTEQCFVLASGCLKIFTLPLAKSGVNSKSDETTKKKVDEMQIMWAEPAQIIYLPEGTDDSDETSVPHLIRILGNMWLNWTKSHAKFNRETNPLELNLWILCEVNSSLTHHGLKDFSSWVWNCGAIVGKLNCHLDYFSLTTIVVLLKQIQCSLCSIEKMRKNVILQSCIQDSLVRDLTGKYLSYLSKVEYDIVRMVPRQHIRIGVLIAGPHVQLSLLDNKFYGEKTGDHLVTHVSLDIHNIELAVSPKLDDNLGCPCEKYSGCDRAAKCPALEAQELDIHKSVIEAYSSRQQISLNACIKIYGLEVYLVESTESQKHQIIMLSPTTAQLQYILEDHRSFGSEIVALSATFCCVATGFTMLIFLDEWYTLMKVISGVLYEALAFAISGSGGGLRFQELPCRQPDYDSGCTVWRSRSSQESLFSSIKLTVHTYCELKSFDLILHSSRKICSLENYTNIMPVERETGRISATHDNSGHGIYIFAHQLMAEVIFKRRDIDFIIDIARIRSIIFRYLAENERSLDKCELKSLLCSLNFLTEASISQSRVCLSFRFFKALPYLALDRTDDPSSSFGKTIRMQEDFPLVPNTEGIGDHWLSVNICLSGIYMAGFPLKDILIHEHKLEEIITVFSIGGASQNVSWKSKGGSLLLEAMAVPLFTKCCTSYCYSILEIWSAGRTFEKTVVLRQARNMAATDNHLSMKPQQFQLQELIWDHLEVFSFCLSHISVILVARDESGRLQELLFEVDFHLNFELLNMVRKISFGLSKFSILSQIMHGGMEHKAKSTRRQFSSSVMTENSFPSFSGKDLSPWLCHEDSIQSHNGDASTSSLFGSGKGFNAHSFTTSLPQKSLKVSPKSFILKDLQCFLAVEGPMQEDENITVFSNNIWVGNGSVSGFDMSISLSEIKMILSAFESFSEVLIRKATSKVQSGKQFKAVEPEGRLEEMIPDGTIVAIQDADQHMYIAVEGSENKYDIAGVIHYSLVGKRALFRVKYHNPGPWKSKFQYFSLISLYAKDGYEKSLRLNSNPRSKFVSISCPDDSGPALWRMFCFKDDDTYEDDFVLETSSPLSERTFHLLNKKNDCAVAFIDGIFEFVSKPGSLFKWKVFSDPVPRNSLLPQNCLLDSSERNLQSESNITDVEESSAKRSSLGITVTVDKITLTLVHDLSDTEEKVPLLQGSITPNQIIIQISKSKFRIMNMLGISLCYFDAQRNSWVEFVQPLELYSFYRSKFQVQGSEDTLRGVPTYFFAKITEVNLSLCELSLDILLFVIGKLDIAGPYAVKKSLISKNYCKVQNQSGLTLLCQFYDNENVSISARHSATIFLRHLDFASRPPEASVLTLQFVDQGFLSTTPIHLSLLDARKLAWRTRIISSQDSKSSPGPVIVLEMSRGIKDGLSIVVSPLFKINNKTDFPLELRFQRPQYKETESASLMLEAGDIIDDFMTAFSAVEFSGGIRKALSSLNVGNFIFSFRPNIVDSLQNLNQPSVEWSDDLKGGKPVHLSRVFDKLSYKMRKAFSADSVKSSLRSASCVLKSEGEVVANIYFLILTVGKGIPVVNPDNFGYTPRNKDLPASMQEQKEIFFLPTIQVTNLLHTDIHVNLTDRDPSISMDHDNIWCNATVSSGSAVNFYTNPETIYFTVTLTSFNSRSKPVNSSDWTRKLLKQKTDVPRLDIELDFDGGKYFATLRLSRGHRGTLEAVLLTSYMFQNDTDSLLLCCAANKKILSRDNARRSGLDVPLEQGSCLPPNSITSWFMKCQKLRLKLSEENALETQLDVDALSGLTEIDLESEDINGLKNIMRLGVSLRPSTTEGVPYQIISLSSRYVVCNESDEVISIRQCYMEEMEDSISINSKQRMALRLKRIKRNKKEMNVIESLLRKHTKSQDDLSLFLQFRLNETGLSWSGPICVASLGRFFLKFKRSSEDKVNHSSNKDNISEFAVVHVVEEGSTIILRFHWPPDTNLPYRIENCLHDAPISYYQKDSSEPEVLGAGVSVGYVWDDLTLPRRLIIQLDDVHLLREINLDKVRSWKPFFRNKQTRGLGFHIPMDKKFEEHKRNTYGQLTGSETVKVGYEVYAEGITRILRICDFSDSHKMDIVSGSRTKIRMRISYFSAHLLGQTNQEIDASELADDAPIILARFERINWDSMFTSLHKYNQIRVQSLSVDEKWVGAPFVAMLRGHQSEKSDANNCILRAVIILLPSNSGVRQVKYLSIVLQPLNLNLDEETLMKVIPFWRRSLSDPSAPRQQYYFDHFEIHPIKIMASFLPGDMHYNYSSTQETMRSLLHSVIQMPAIQNKTVELNGVLVTHALITLRELTIKCAQHYSWYSMRAIYIAKGSPLLPPAFTSIFDDSASSSLDVFFDPSSGLLNLPGVTLGTLKLISKFIDNKGFSGTKRYFGDLGKTLKTAGSNILFAAVTEVSDSVLKGAETSGLNGMLGGFHKGILKLAMEPSVLGNAFMEGGPDRKIKLDRTPGIDELYIEGYLQAMLDTMYKQEYLRVKIIDNQVVLKNLPPSSTLINEIMESVKSFLASKALLKGETSTSASLRYLRGEREWRLGPTLLTLCEHLFVSFAIRFLRKQAGKVVGSIKYKGTNEEKAVVSSDDVKQQKVKLVWKWGIGKFVLSGIIAYVDGRLCRCIPNPLARRIVSGFLLSFLDTSNDDSR